MHMNHSDISKTLILACAQLFIHATVQSTKKHCCVCPSLLSFDPLNAVCTIARCKKKALMLLLACDGEQKEFSTTTTIANHNVDSKKCHWNCNVSVIHCHCGKTNKRRPWTYPIHHIKCQRKTLEIHTWNGFDGSHQNKSKRKMEELTKFTSTFRWVGLNGISGDRGM